MVKVMWICAECHSTDKEIIICVKPEKHHPNHAYGSCEICGKDVDTGFTCDIYDSYIEEVKNESI